MVNHVFSRNWFKRKQRSLLFLLNNVATKRYFRSILDLDYHKPVVYISPFEVIYAERDGKYSLETHIARKFGYRLYSRCLPVWNLFHNFDMFFANKFMPSFNLGFDTLLKYPDAHSETTTVDGKVGRTAVSETWQTIKAGDGNYVQDATTDIECYRITNPTSTTYSSLVRGVILFDTHLMGEGATISDATVSLFGRSKINGGSATPLVNIYTSSPASDTALDVADYGTFGTTQLSTSIAYADWSTAAYNDFALNPDGLAAIAVTGISKLGTREAKYDAGTTSAGSLFGSGEDKCAAWAAEDTTADNGRDPKLFITYTPAGGAPIEELDFD